MPKFAINIILNDLEARSGDLEKQPPEIVKWKNEEHTLCYVIALFHKNNEGYELQFIGDRPFQENKNEFWLVAETTQKILDMYFKSNGDKT